VSHLPDIAVTVTIGQLDRQRHGALILYLEGELDLAGAEVCAVHFRDALAALLPPSLIVIDLAGVRFLGVAGLRVLFTFAAEAAAQGIHTRFLLPARLKRIMLRVGVAAELARFDVIDDVLIDGPVVAAVDPPQRPTGGEPVMQASAGSGLVG